MITNPVDLKKLIRDFPDFPKRGVLFRDINPLLADRDALRYMADEFYRRFESTRPDVVAGIESRGFIIATSLAVRFGLGMTMIRKAGKLPGKIMRESYEIEYGSSVMEIQQDNLLSGQNVIIADDLIATGGTALAAAKLLKATGAHICGFAILIEMSDLKGGDILRRLGHNFQALIRF